MTILVTPAVGDPIRASWALAVSQSIFGDSAGPQNLTLAAGFTGTVTVLKVGPNAVMYGAVTRTAGTFLNSATTIGTLPSGFRPAVFCRLPLAGVASATANGAYIQFGTGTDDVVIGGVNANNATMYLTGIFWPLP